MADQENVTDDTDETPAIDLARTTLRGDIRDHLLEFLKHNKDTLPWDALSESRQRELVQRTENFADNLVDNCAEIIAADGRVTVSWGIKKVELVKEGIKVVLVAPYEDDAWLNLGKATRMTTCSVETAPYRGQRRPGDRHVTPDQPGLIDPDDDTAGDEGPVFDQTPSGKGAGKGRKGKGQDAPAAPKAKAADDGDDTPTESDMERIASKVREVMADGADFENALLEAQKKFGFSMNPAVIALIKQTLGLGGEDAADLDDGDDDADRDPDPLPDDDIGNDDLDD